jgi:hypothetical protein
MTTPADCPRHYWVQVAGWACERCGEPKTPKAPEPVLALIREVHWRAEERADGVLAGLLAEIPIEILTEAGVVT